MKMKNIIARPKVIIGAGEAKSGAPLTPLLGPHNVDIKKFNELFNEKTSSINNGIEVVAYINKYSRTTFEVLIKPTPASKLILNGVVNEQNIITLEQIYDIVRVRELFINHFYKKKIDKEEFMLLARNTIAVIRSFHNVKINSTFYSDYDL
uniref:Ribosomal protein L11 n=1 Tax=Phalansterium sp. PJK-2012 TaxID=1267188 RepID=T1QE57_9EUKA|nr:ribosomal protein L11 [Phalansterium sp. PJK-2012]